MKNKAKVIILLITILIISVIIIGKDFKKDTINTILPSDYVKIATTTDKELFISKKLMLIDISDEAIKDWDTYENKKFEFNIKYPCDSSCRDFISKSKPSPNAYLKEKVTVPIIQGKLSVGIGVLTKESVDRWNEFVATPNLEAEHVGRPFKFSMEDMKNAVLLPVGSNTNLVLYGDKKYGEEAQIVTINDKKAILLYNINKRTYPKRTYFIHDTDDVWLQITEWYWNFSGDFSQPLTIDSETKQLMTIASKITETLSFKELK